MTYRPTNQYYVYNPYHFLIILGSDIIFKN